MKTEACMLGLTVCKHVRDIFGDTARLDTTDCLETHRTDPKDTENTHKKPRFREKIGHILAKILWEDVLGLFPQTQL